MKTKSKPKKIKTENSENLNASIRLIEEKDDVNYIKSQTKKNHDKARYIQSQNNKNNRTISKSKSKPKTATTKKQIEVFTIKSKSKSKPKVKNIKNFKL